MTTVSVNPLTQRAQAAWAQREERSAEAARAETERLMDVWRERALIAAIKALDVDRMAVTVGTALVETGDDYGLLAVVVEGLEFRWSMRNSGALIYTARCECGMERTTHVTDLPALGFALQPVHPDGCPVALVQPFAARPEPSRTRIETTLLDALVDFLAERGIGPEEGS